jgi:tRNA dimethylallyltransferase
VSRPDPRSTPTGQPAGHPVLVLVGPTAAGKSQLGVELARALHGDVVNADSMQLYQGMDIGTAKPSLAERRGVPHHLLDVWEVTRTASVAEYQRLARAVIGDLLSRGRPPVLVGGSGLYVRAAVDDLVFPGTDPHARAALESELSRLGAAALHARLARLDPAAAAAILPSNGRRVVRALEVLELTGRPFTAALPAYRSRPGTVLLGLDPLDLEERIERRVNRMWELGFVAEVRGLAGRGLREGRTAAKALGYAQVLRMLDGGLDESAARAETVSSTRRFARRQRSWFRRDPRVCWLSGPDLVGEAISRVGDAISRVASAEP